MIVGPFCFILTGVWFGVLFLDILMWHSSGSMYLSNYFLPLIHYISLTATKYLLQYTLTDGVPSRAVSFCQYLFSLEVVIKVN